MTEEKSMVDALIQNPFGEDVVKNTTLQEAESYFPSCSNRSTASGNHSTILKR